MALRRASQKVRSLASGARGTRGARPRLGGDACSTTYRGKELKESEEERDEERGGHGASEGVSLSSALRCRSAPGACAAAAAAGRRARRLGEHADLAAFRRRRCLLPASGLAQREQHPGVQKAVRDREAPPPLRTLRHELHFLSLSLSLSLYCSFMYCLYHAAATDKRTQTACDCTHTQLFLCCRSSSDSASPRPWMAPAPLCFGPELFLSWEERRRGAGAPLAAPELGAGGLRPAERRAG